MEGVHGGGDIEVARLDGVAVLSVVGVLSVELEPMLIGNASISPLASPPIARERECV